MFAEKNSSRNEAKRLIPSSSENNGSKSSRASSNKTSSRKEEGAVGCFAALFRRRRVASHINDTGNALEMCGNNRVVGGRQHTIVARAKVLAEKELKPALDRLDINDLERQMFWRQLNKVYQLTILNLRPKDSGDEVAGVTRWVVSNLGAKFAKKYTNFLQQVASMVMESKLDPPINASVFHG